ncbi:hypothetical protein D3C73_1638040 [compost metagenome]
MFGIADTEQSTLDITCRQHQGRQTVLGMGHDAVAGQVKHTHDPAVRVFERHRYAGKAAETIEVVFTAID